MILWKDRKKMKKIIVATEASRSFIQRAKVICTTHTFKFSVAWIFGVIFWFSKNVGLFIRVHICESKYSKCQFSLTSSSVFSEWVLMFLFKLLWMVGWLGLTAAVLHSHLHCRQHVVANQHQPNTNLQLLELITLSVLLRTLQIVGIAVALIQIYSLHCSFIA